MERHYFAYIMASLSRRTYIGVTNGLVRRVIEHKEGRVPGFTKQYRMRRLVHFEQFRYVNSAIAREKQLKSWRRSRKVALIESRNPTWADLAESWGNAPIRKSRSLGAQTALGMTNE